MTEVPSYRFARKYHFIGILVLIAVSVPMHFIYEWLGEARIVGYFAPINESIWEHLKLAFWPTLLWWGIGFFIFRKKHKLQPMTWFYASFFSILTTPIVIVSYYYTFTAGLNIVSSTLNIASIFIGFFIGQLVALHVYRYTTRPNPIVFWFLAAIIIGFGGMLTFLTYQPPNIPIFSEPEQG